MTRVKNIITIAMTMIALTSTTTPSENNLPNCAAEMLGGGDSGS